MRLGPTIALFSVSIITVGLCGGCESTDSLKPAAASGAKFFIVKVDSTPFYRFGPAQFTGSDMILPKDTLVTLVRAETGWSKIKLTSGDQGYVANEDLTIAPSAAITAVKPPHVRRSRTFQADPDPSFSLPEPSTDIQPTPISTPPDIEPTPIPVLSKRTGRKPMPVETPPVPDADKPSIEISAGTPSEKLSPIVKQRPKNKNRQRIVIPK